LNGRLTSLWEVRVAGYSVLRSRICLSAYWLN